VTVASGQVVTMNAAETYDPETSAICQAQYDSSNDQNGWSFDHFTEDDCLEFVWTYTGCTGNCNPDGLAPVLQYTNPDLNNGNGFTYQLTPGQAFSWGQTSVSFTAPFVQYTQTGIHTFVLTVTDPTGLFDTETIQITVTGINHAPEVAMQTTVTDYFGSTTHGPVPDTTYDQPQIINTKSGDVLTFTGIPSDVDGTSAWWPAIVSEGSESCTGFIDCSVFDGNQPNCESVGGVFCWWNNPEQKCANEGAGNGLRCNQYWSWSGECPEEFPGDCTYSTGGSNTFWEVYEGSNIAFSSANQLETEGIMPYISPGSDPLDIMVHFAAADYSSLSYVGDGWINLSIAADQAPYVVEWVYNNNYSWDAGLSMLAPNQSTEWVLSAYDENDCPEGPSNFPPVICFDCTGSYPSTGCLNYSDFSIDSGAEMVAASSFLHQHGSDRLWPSSVITMIDGGPGDDVWLTSDGTYCPDVYMSVTIEDQLSEGDDYGTAVSSIQTQCPQVWTIPTTNDAYWRLSMTEDTAATTDKFDFYCPINPTAGPPFFQYTINSPEGFIVQDNGFEEISGVTDRYRLLLHITPPDDVSGDFSLTVNLNVASPFWDGDLSATLALAVGAVADYETPPELYGVGPTGTLISGEEEYTLTQLYSYSQFPMDERTSGQFSFDVYDPDDGGEYGESISATFDLPDGVILYDGTDSTMLPNGVLDCPLTSESFIFNCNFFLHLVPHLIDPGTVQTIPITVRDHAWENFTDTPNDTTGFNLSLQIMNVNDPPVINISVST